MINGLGFKYVQGHSDVLNKWDYTIVPLYMNVVLHHCSITGRVLESVDCVLQYVRVVNITHGMTNSYYSKQPSIMDRSTNPIGGHYTESKLNLLCGGVILHATELGKQQDCESEKNELTWCYV